MLPAYMAVSMLEPGYSRVRPLPDNGAYLPLIWGSPHKSNTELASGLPSKNVDLVKIPKTNLLSLSSKPKSTAVIQCPANKGILMADFM